MGEHAHDHDLPLEPGRAAEGDERDEPIETADEPEAPEPAPPPDADEPEAITPSPSPPSESELDAQADKLQRAAKVYTKKVVETLGEDLAGWVVCDLCAPFVPGLRLPVEVDDATKEKLRVLIGLPGMANYKQDKFSATCTDCEGQGRVLTGSQVAQQTTQQCITCAGRGWVPVGTERAAAPAIALAPEPPTELAEVALPAGAMPPAALAALRATVEAAERAAQAG